jgi:hypothetical protein
MFNDGGYVRHRKSGRTNSTKSENETLDIWIANKHTLDELLKNRVEVSKNVARLASQTKLFAGRDLFEKCQQDLMAFANVYDALKIYEGTPFGLVNKKVAPLKSFLHSNIDIIANRLRLQFGDANEIITGSLDKLFSTSDNSEKYNQATAINTLARNYFLLDDAITLDYIDNALSESAESHKVNKFTLAYGRAVHDLETFTIESVQREYARSVSAIDLRDLAEGLELEIKSMIEEQKNTLESYIAFFPVQASAKKINLLLEKGLSIGRNNLYKEIRQVMNDPNKYFSFRGELGNEVSKLRGIVHYVQSLVSSKEEAEKIGIEKLEALKTHGNYLDQNKRMSSMKLMQIEANAYSTLYSQLMSSVDQVIDMLKPADLNEDKSTSELELISSESISCSDDHDAQLRTDVGASSVYNPNTDYNSNMVGDDCVDTSIMDSSQQHPSFVKLHDLRMPTNDSLKALYLTINRVNCEGFALIADPEQLAANINGFKLDTKAEKLIAEDKIFLAGVVDYLSNTSGNHFGHFDQQNPISNHVPQFLSTYSSMQ